MQYFKNKLELNTEENTIINKDEIQILNISMKIFRRSLTNRMKQANESIKTQSEEL